MAVVARSTLSWLRILVAVEWLAVGVGVMVDVLLVDSLPEPLRSWAPETGSMGDEVRVLAVLLLTLGLHVAGSIAILAAWPTARALYTASTVALLAVLPWTGPSITHGFSQPLYLIASLASGAVLALLHLSPRDLPAAPEGSAPLRAIRTGALLSVGALAGIGALAIALGVLAYGMITVWQDADEEARRIGTGSDDAGCLAAAHERMRGTTNWFDWNFLDACLETAAPTEAFCRDVPTLRPEEEEEGSAWAAARCEGVPTRNECHGLYYTVQVHCGARR